MDPNMMSGNGLLEKGGGRIPVNVKIFSISDGDEAINAFLNTVDLVGKGIIQEGSTLIFLYKNKILDPNAHVITEEDLVEAERRVIFDLIGTTVQQLTPHRVNIATFSKRLAEVKENLEKAQKGGDKKAVYELEQKVKDYEKRLNNSQITFNERQFDYKVLLEVLGEINNRGEAKAKKEKGDN